MQVTRRSRLLLRLQSTLFTALFIGVIGMLGWLSTQYVYQADWTYGGRNTVSDETRKLLGELNEPVEITAYIRDDALLKSRIRELVDSYRRFKNDIKLTFINPDTVPERVRELDIASGGQVIIRYRDRSEQLQTLGERQLTNALLRLSRQSERWIVFLTGHGERRPGGETNLGLGLFSQELERKGLHVLTLNLVENDVPDNTSLLVLASPRVDLLPGEVDKLLAYTDAGGNLLWLAEPGDRHGLEPLAEQLGVTFLPGLVVDATTQMFGIDNPDFAIITGYPRHAITRELTAITVFPEAVALDINNNDRWSALPLLTTLARSWTELDALEGQIGFDKNTDERAGPLDIGIVLTRNPANDQQDDNADDPAHTGSTASQRIIVIGDGDFLSNTYLGNAGNLGLGLNIVHWLGHDDAYIDIRIKSAPDTRLVLGTVAQAVIGIGFLFGLPLLLLVTGLVIWTRRRRR